MGLTFAGLGLLPLPEVTAIGYATPIFTVIFAALLLGERIRVFRISAVALGLVGVMIVMWPRLTVTDLSNAASIGALMVLIASILRALVQIHVRRLVQTEHTKTHSFLVLGHGDALSLLTMFFGWVWPGPRGVGSARWRRAFGRGGADPGHLVLSLRWGEHVGALRLHLDDLCRADRVGRLRRASTAVMLVGSALVIAGGWADPLARAQPRRGPQARPSIAVSDPKA